MNNLQGAISYMNEVQNILQQIAVSQMEAVSRAAGVVVQSVKEDGIIYLFGTGHSHMLAEEGHYRAGGFAPVCPILPANIMIHESATLASKYERTPGLAPIILSHYQTKPQDVMFIFSNSGVNAMPVEMALEAKNAGMSVIGIVALEYAAQAPLSVFKKRLADVVDITIDNCTPAGDALVDVDGTNIKSGPASTIAGAFLLNAVLTEAVTRLAAEGYTPPVYISANMPAAHENNCALVQRFRGRNPHL